ncbi:hypothetical protein [Kitasatospora sp. NPDC094015]|uniref:hypothetical protein n=1 Tax=Kitasatospora sp. NPDC094015 TaxID=3155205 RepID=UPI003328DFD7
MTAHRTLSLGALLAVALLGGCSAPDAGSLDAQSATASPTCLVHQTKLPADRYAAGAGANTGSVLELLRYYTANGTKAFCDGKPPSGTDRRWMDLYADLGGDRSHVARPEQVPPIG